MSKKTHIVGIIITVLMAVLVSGGVQALSPAMATLENNPITSCGTSPTKITSTSLIPRSICVQNTNAVSVFLGGSGVTTATGLIVPPGTATDPETFCLDVQTLWCIAESPQDVRVGYGTGYSGR